MKEHGRDGMKAVLSKSVGGPETLVLEELPSPQAGPGQVVLSVKACGVTFARSMIERVIEERARGDASLECGGMVAG